MDVEYGMTQFLITECYVLHVNRFQDSNVIAPVVNVTVSIFNTTDDDGEDFFDESNPLPPHITSYTFSGVPKGRNYTIELVVTNVIGNSFISQFFPSKQCKFSLL